MVLSSSSHRRVQRIAVIGAGIGGLTAAALLAKQGFRVTVYEQADLPGGCASTFRRRGFTFDVGATQVGGFGPGGIHTQIFAELGVPLPESTPCDPACAVYLPGETEPIRVWRHPERWRAERQHHFPGSEPFWQFLGDLFARSWRFQNRNPVLPPRHPWDFWQALRAMRWDTLDTLPFTFSTVGDALAGFGLADDRRLRTFLDLQLKLYSQVDASETALLYGATALAVAQAPLGIDHLHGSMQVLSDRLVTALKNYHGTLHCRQRVQAIALNPLRLSIHDSRHQQTSWQEADLIVANIPIHNLAALLGEHLPRGYQQRVAQLPEPTGAFVVYLGVHRSALPDHAPPHLQVLDAYGSQGRSLFVSLSQEGDGRAPTGYATITASEFTPAAPWFAADVPYETLKEQFTQRAIAQLQAHCSLNAATVIVREAATPCTFARYTARHRGYVGGLGMRVPEFGPFAFSSRTPLERVFLVGDNIHPGEGTAGVSYGAQTVVRQICQQFG
jgi:C-3',4' desaturase CrtD